MAGSGLNIAIIGAGWAGLAAAVRATEEGHNATVFEASNTLGGRARALMVTLPDGRELALDNGQHILIGAYHATRQLLRTVGVQAENVLLDLPMTLQFADGDGLRFTDWPTPLDALGGILLARGWTWSDKVSLLNQAVRWRLKGFQCPPDLTVDDLCRALTPRVRQELIEPLCVSALNTPAQQASGTVFLRVLRDAMFGARGGSHLLLPMTDLSSLFPDAAASWLQQHGSLVRRNARVEGWHRDGKHWLLDVNDKYHPMASRRYDTLVLATSASNAAQALIQHANVAINNISKSCHEWATTAQSLRFEAIATVYAYHPHTTLSEPMLALRSDAVCPAQFVFDRGRLGGPKGLLAFVVSAARDDKADLQQQVLTQARQQLGLDLQAVQTIVEKRATFACTPQLKRPPTYVAPGLFACGDYIDGPYPATLEGAVLSGQAVIQTILSHQTPA